VTRRTRLIIGVAGVLALLLAAGLYVWRSTPVAVAAAIEVVAAGDIACDPAYPDFNSGAGTAVGCHEKATADLVATINPQAVLALGDIQYVHGTLANYAASYDPTWGRFKNITHPVLGNHEGGEGGTNKTYFAYFGQSAGDPAKGYYSFDLGGWHLIALNSNCGEYSFNKSHDGCAPGSPQDLWLKNDLATHPAMCTLAYFHVPRFSSGSDHHSDASSDQTLTTLWRDLYAGGADVILNGHAVSVNSSSARAAMITTLLPQRCTAARCGTAIPSVSCNSPCAPRPTIISSSTTARPVRPTLTTVPRNATPSLGWRGYVQPVISAPEADQLGV